MVGLSVLLIFFFLGFSLDVNLRYIPKPLTSNEYYAVLDEFPIEKGKSYKAVIRLLDPKIKVLAYFEKSEELAYVTPGSLLYFKGRPELIINQGNPFEFDYRLYSIRNKIGHRIFLKSNSYHFLHSLKILNLQDRALILRDKLLARLSQNGVKGETFHVISAITFGARDNLDPETTQSFIKTGTIHVLAVSGGNVVVIFILLDFLFRFLKKHRVGILLHTLCLVAGIWGYALITGLSPSVLRASVMFTFIVVGNNISRRPNVYNSLAASAFILLCINPAILYDVGFQLSYAAVFAIVILQPFFYKIFYFKYWIVNQIWVYLTVSVAAQIGTLPFSLFYFHQFPSYFWLTNMLVVPLVMILLYFTLLVIAIGPYIPYIGLLMGHILNWICDKMLEFLQYIEKLPFAVIENLYYSAVGLALTTIFLILLTTFIIYKKGEIALLALVSLTMLLLINNKSLYNALSRKEVIVFNIPGKTLLAFTNGRATTWLANEKPEQFKDMRYFTKPYEGYRMIKNTALICLSDSSFQSNNSLNLKKNFLNYLGLKIHLLNNKEIKNQSVEGFPRSDIILLTENSVQLSSYLHYTSYVAPIICCRSPVLCSKAESYSELALEEDMKLKSKEGRAIKISIDQISDSGRTEFRVVYFDE